MSRVPLLAGLSAVAALIAALWSVPQSRAVPAVLLFQPDEAEAELARATGESRRAAARAARFAREAEAATEAAQRSAREAAALAARIQQAEADLEAARARYTLVRAARAELTARLAKQQEPAARLVGALQVAARRPLALSALQPGSLEDLVHVRAVLATAVPAIRQRTQGLRADVERGQALEARAERALAALRAGEAALRARRQRLAGLETRQRLASREARAGAAREAERALALAEEARDLDGLVRRLDEVAALRRDLAALPGPVLRPANLSDLSGAPPEPVRASPAATAPPPRGFQLPVHGRTLVGFGERRASGLASTGITLAPAADAQVVAPAAGRVAFAGPYRGFGRIVIIEHDGGWTSLVTGLARIDVAVGDVLIGGSPMGAAGRRGEAVTIELRRAGEPVNPLQFLG